MNNLEPGNGRRLRPENDPADTARPRREGGPPPRKKKKNPNILPAVLLGVVGVVVIALVIMGFKALFSRMMPENESDPASSSILDATPEPPTTASGGEPTPAPSTPAPALTPAPEADIAGKEIVQYGDKVRVGDSAYDYYKFDKTVADRFTAAIKASASTLPDGIKSYSMIIPGAVDIMLPLSFLEEQADKTSDQNKAIAYVSQGLNEGTQPIFIYDILKAHCNEALYFRTDNHWTGLAAYYAYTRWAEQTGLTPAPLSDYQRTAFTGFRGNHYTYLESSALTEEELEVYKPKAKLSAKNGAGDDAAQGSVFADVTESDADGKFSAFLGGSRGCTKITNGDLSDGSACVVVMDSNGTALAPYIAQHYQYTYAVDYRQYEESLSALVGSSGAKDVIYCTSIVATKAESLVESLEGLK